MGRNARSDGVPPERSWAVVALIQRGADYRLLAASNPNLTTFFPYPQIKKKPWLSDQGLSQPNIRLIRPINLL
jgi:hypothetical protein